MNVRRNWRPSKENRRGSPTAQAKGGAGDAKLSPPCQLRHVEGLKLSELAPGDLLLLDGAESSSPTEPDDAPVFLAVLSCPLCGAPTLITLAQYSGTMPVMCRSERCPGLYRILDEARFDYLPLI